MRKTSVWLRLLILLVLSILYLSVNLSAAVPGRVIVNGAQFQVCGSRIWMAGANTPWDNWNDFGGIYDGAWWDSHYTQFNPNGLNASRVWITCSGEVGINIDASGHVSGATAAHWANLDDFFAKAQNRGVYIMATLISFDHFKNTYATYQSWRNWANSDANIDSYITNYLIPFVTRYGVNPALWCIDMTNEPEWATTDEGGSLAWARLQQFWAKAANAIHENSQTLVTVGMGVIKYNSDNAGMNGNKVSDAALQAQFNDPHAKLDFYSPHWYSWMDPYWTTLMYVTPASFGISAKPCMVGECSANGSTGHTLTQDYEAALTNGWQGMLPWTSNGVDTNGGWAQVQPAALSFKNNHNALVLPVCAGGTPTFTATPTSTRTPTRTNTPVNTSTNTATKTATATRSASATASVIPTGTYTITQTRTASVSPTNSYTRTPSNTPANTYTFTATQTAITTRTNTPVNTSTFTATRSATASVSPTNTNTRTPANTPVNTATNTPANTATLTSTLISTATATCSETPELTLTATYTGAPPTSTVTPAVSRTFTALPSATFTATNTFTGVSTPTFTRTFTHVNTSTPSTSVSPSFSVTSSVVPTATRTSTQVSSPTRTSTPVSTQTFTGAPSFTATGSRTMTVTITVSMTRTCSQTPIPLSPTPTFTPTPATAWSDKFQITETLIYPNPYKPDSGNLRVKITITKPASELYVRIYTASFRCVLDIPVGAAATREAVITIPQYRLNRLSAGTYYIVVTGSAGNQKAVSKPMIFQLLK